MKRTLKRYLALLLSLVMVGSMLTDAFSVAWAAEAGDSAATTQTNYDASSPLTGKPNLYVDFLGDNMGHNTGKTTNLGNLVPPERYDQSKDGKHGGDWKRYDGSDVTNAGAGRIIFWVGVGIDRMNVLDLFAKDDKGLYTTEIGFYYNDTFIEPYAGPDGYAATITAANVGNPSYPNQWSNEYQVIHAEKGLAPQTDWVTQENIDQSSIHDVTPATKNDGMAQIMADGSPWKMTYISLEKKDGSTGDNRFDGDYTGAFDGKDESKNGETEYLLMIPFVLKQYDSNKRMCLRLARNAHLLSLGADGTGADQYAAWERVTTRNPGHDLKLMTNFTGDLNIFTGKKELEEPWMAELQIRKGGGAANWAKMSITGDPSPNKVVVDKNGDQITGLYGGTGLTVDVHVISGYEVTVEAYEWGTEPKPNERPGPDSVPVTVSTIRAAAPGTDGDYRLIMPVTPKEMDITVVVTFTAVSVDTFFLALVEDRTAEAEDIKGNKATVTVAHTETGGTTKEDFIDSDTPADPNGRRNITAKETDPVSVVITTHPDYEAQVVVVDPDNDPWPNYTITDPSGLTPGSDAAVTLPAGGTFTLSMPKSDLDIHVKFVPAKTYTAKLVLDHDPLTDAVPENVAQLSYTKYDKAGTGSRDYSGVVYHDYDATNPSAVKNDHSAVETAPPNRVLRAVDASEAKRSGSLGGDGQGMAAQDWTRLMSYVYAAAARTDLDNKLIPYDLRETVVNTKKADLRKNAAGDYYGDGDLSGFLDRMWILNQELAADPTTAALYRKTMPDPADSTKVLYTYYNLTPAQVQVYLLDWAQYDKDKAEFDQKVAEGDTSATAPTPPKLKDDTTAVGGMPASWPAATGGSTNFVTTRYDRELTLTLEANSAYRVKKIKLVEVRDPDAVGPAQETTLTASDKDVNYANVYRFPMPTYDCEVRVVYEKRPVHDLSFAVVGTGLNVTGNASELVAFGPDTTNASATVPATHKLTATIADPVTVFDGSTVTVTVGRASGYTVSLVAKTASGSILINEANVASGKVFTFTMPADAVSVTVTYSEVAKPKHNAYIDYKHQGASGFADDAYWQAATGKPTTLNDVSQDTVLTGEIVVEKGFYIHSVRAYTKAGSLETGNVSYVLSGNGYRNGGGGKETVTVTMPGADLYVDVVFAKGPPPEEPDYNLSLMVSDPANTPVSGVYADNHATLTVEGGTPSSQVSPYGSTKSYSTYTNGGKLVTVDMTAAAGYYVDSVTVSPSNFGVTVLWKSETQVQFYMPGGDVGVTVTFGKGAKPTYFLNLDKTETGAGPEVKNTIKKVRSNTIATIVTNGHDVSGLPARIPDTGTIGAAAAGETVRLDIEVLTGWYIDSLTITAADGATVPYTLPDNGYDAVGTAGAVKTVIAEFQMPRGEATAVVHYRLGPPPADKEYRLDVSVADPDNVTDGTTTWKPADNWAKATVTRPGVAANVVGPLGLGTTGTATLTGSAYAMMGDVVTVEFHPAAGYALDYIRLGPAGSKVVPIFTGPNTAVFTMPAGQTSVEVRFKAGAATQYTANLILRVPDGADYTVADAGQGTFTAPTAGTLTAPVYSAAAVPGAALNLDLFANPGYYIKKITVTPASAEATAAWSGAFASQSGSFVMPPANVYVNVYFEKAWPDDATYDMTLKVTDPYGSTDNYANFVSVNGTALGDDDKEKVLGGGSRTVVDKAKDKDTVFVAIHQGTGYLAEGKNITITTAGGKTLDWTYAVEGGVSGIRFTMPPENVIIQVIYTKGTASSHDVTIYVADGTEPTVSNEIKFQGSPVTYSKASDYTSAHTATAIPGTEQKLELTPDGTAKVAAAYAVNKTTGEQLIIPVTQVAAGGTASFAMPEADVDVYVKFAKGPVPAGEHVATLTVAGPANSGEATMKAVIYKADGSVDRTALTEDVTAGGSGLLTAPKDSTATVTITPEAGHLVKSVSVVDGTGKAVPFAWAGGSYDAEGVWTPAANQTLTFTMPDKDVHVLVILEKIPADLLFTAQVVVNDEAYTDTATASENGAVLKKALTDAGALKLTGLAAGDQLLLDLDVHPGFKIESITVVPQEHGIVPGMALAPTRSQSTSFTMPADDVVVYVKFVKDGLVRYNATLDVTGTPGTAFKDNKATIESPVSGVKGPIATDDAPVSVQAAPGVEWVTVEYDIQANSSVASITVLDAAGNYVPFTQKKNKVDEITGHIDKGSITFPMVASNVRVIVDYKDTPTPKGHDAVIHVIDLDDGNPNASSWGSLTYTDAPPTTPPSPPPSTDKVYAVPAPGGTGTISVPAGETVDLAAFADTGVYIKAAYVLFQEHNQMVECGLTPDGTPDYGFTGSKTSSFVMHPGQNDVYIYVTKTDPDVTEFASVLMLTGPEADKDSSAKMVGAHKQEANVKTNGAHGYIAARTGETVTVTVTPAAGYGIESILMTPLGIPITPVKTGNTYTFTMPAYNVAVHIKLKESTAKEYTATLHLVDKDGNEITPPSTSPDLGKLSCAATGVATKQSEDKMEITVSEKETVELWAKPYTGNTILAAYVMKGATMVSLGDSLEGETGECATSFTMPNGNVDVYLVFTDTPPTGDWYTAVLVVTDDDGQGTLNSKKNSATFVSSVTNTTSDLVTSDGERTHFYTVVAGELVTIHANNPASGYVLDGVPAISASSLPDLTLATLANNTYWYAVPYYNSAVHVHYKSTSVTERDLTVRIVDPDTPGDGTVTQTVVAEPAGMAALSVTSKSTAGAIQTIHKVEKDKAVSVTITPNSGYYPVAVLTYGTGADAVAEELTLKESGGVYTIDPGGSFPMPGEDATLTVTFFQAYEATLTLKDTSTSDASNRPYMAESAFGHRITVDNSDPTKTLTALPNGTNLTITVPVVAEQSQLVGVLLTVDGSTTVMKGTTVADGQDTSHDEYYHTISRADAEVTVVIESQSAAPSHLAAVKLVNAPAGVAADTILSNTTNPAAAGGAIWRTAQKDDTLELAVKVPTGYRVELTAVDATGTSVALSAGSLAADGAVTFTMPGADTQVTVQYFRTQFTATLQVVDETAESNAVSMSDGTTILTGDGTISGLTKDAPITLSATPVANTYLSGIILREKTTGKTEYLSGKLAEGVAYPGTGFPMPEDDVEVTVIFGETIAPDGKDLYIATVTTAGTDGERGNRALEVLNQTTADLPPTAANLWAAGYEGDTMLVSYTVAPGYYAVVTAATEAGTALTVLQQDMDNAGTAAITMPAADALITITYQKTPPTDAGKLTLTLVGHDGVADNGATLSVEGASGAIGIDGKTWVDSGNKKEDDATVTGLNATVGDSLYLDASRQASNPEYEIYRVTISVKKGTAEEVTTEVHFNEYGATAAALMYMPAEDAEVTVYYRRIYTATLSIKDTSADKKSTVSMTDDRPGTTPVTTDGGKLTGLVGTEEISSTVTVDTNARLVGVVYTTEKRGTRLPTPDSTVTPPTYQNDFTMDLEDVTVTAVLEPLDGKSHIAMVEYTLDSQGLDQAGNYAEVTNFTNTGATKGTGWTAAEKEDRVDVTVHLQAGYQAEILWVSAAKDRDTTNDLVTKNEIYVNRKIFVKDGKTASFTMPDDDAIVLIRYIEGYTATLDFQDNPQEKDDQAVMAVDAMDTITGTSGGNTVTYTNGTETTDHVDHVPAATQVTATGTPKDTSKTVRILKHTDFTGTSNVSAATGVTSGSFNMPAENTLVSVIMDPNPLIAKVQLKGETDIVGNGVNIENETTKPTATTHGTIWTTTKEKDNIQVTLTVANGYIAIARVLRDDSPASAPVYLTNLSSTDGTVEDTGDMVSFTYKDTSTNPNISDAQTFTFVMPEDRAPGANGTDDPGDSATDVTVIVEFVYAGAIPRPHDPQRTADGALKAGYIYGENRGGYAVVTVPTLYDDVTLANADKYNSSTITYRFYLHDKTTGEYTELEQGKDILLAPADPDTLADPGDKYNYGTYYTANPGGSGETKYTGARFKLSLAETDDTKQTAQAKELAKILVNDGTLPDTQLYILAENGAGEQSAYVQTVINPFYAITGTLVSYAPTHEATITLHRAMTQAELEAKFGIGTVFNDMDPDHYMDTPDVTQTVKEESGSGLWSQEFYIGSSELIPDPANPPTYLLAVQKPGHITYRHVALTLDTADSAYDTTDKIFTINGDIGLIPGDVTGDWRVNLNDRDVLMGFLSWGDTWSTEPEEKADGSNAAEWAISIYNPATTVYRCDLDGDGNITFSDLDIIQRYMRYTYKEYNTGGVLPNGFRSVVTLDLAADLMEELLPEEQPEVPPEGAIDPDFSVDPEEPADPEVPLDPEFSVDPDNPVDPNPDADLPPTPSPDPVPDPVPPPPDPEEDPEEPENESQEEMPPPEGEEAGGTPETAPEPPELPDTATE